MSKGEIIDLVVLRIQSDLDIFQKTKTIPHTINGRATLYKLTPLAFIAVHSFRFTTPPKLNTVEINTAIGRPMLVK